MTELQFLSTASAWPKTRLSNSDVSARLNRAEVTPEWIESRTGIKERRIVSESAETAATLASQAAHTALTRARLSGSDIDLIIVATCTAESSIPSVACRVQNQIQAKGAIAFDVNAACSGFLHALSTAEGLFKLGRAKNALIVGVDVLSRVTNWSDPDTAILFGDGAGACIIRAGHRKQSGILSCKLYGNGEENDLFEIVPAATTMTMKGREIFKSSVKTMATLANEALEAANLTISDVDFIVPHQANLRILEALARRLEFPIEKVVVNIDRFGNTSAATIPTALDEAVLDGRITHGKTLLFVAFGAGTTSAATVVRW